MGSTQKILKGPGLEKAKQIFANSSTILKIKDSQIFGFKFTDKAFFRGQIEAHVLGECDFYVFNTSPATGLQKWYIDKRKVYADHDMNGYLFYLNCVIPLKTIVSETADNEPLFNTNRKFFKMAVLSVLENYENKKLTKSQSALLLSIKNKINRF